MNLGELSYLTCGDKGDVINVCVFPIDEADWERFRREVTVDKVAACYGSLVRGHITRYEFTASKGLNFVMEGALEGGVSISLRTDPHGKAFADLIGEIEIGE